MGDVTADYLALRREVGARVAPRDVLRVRGTDAVTFLQGQLSADVAALAEGDHCWSLLLEPQGKVDAWLRVWRTGAEEMVLDVDGGWGERTSQRLHRFKLRVDATIEPLDWRCVALRGPAAADVAADDGAAELAGGVDWRGLPGRDLLGPSVAVPAGVAEVGPDAWTSVRVEQGWPEMGRELDDTVIPAEAGQWLVDRSVSFTKGCYTGQELVARVDSRGGNTPRHLRGVVLGTNVLPPEGAEVVADDTVRGTLTSVGESLDLRAPVALALVHRSVEPGAAVSVRWPGGEAPATVRELPLL
ncbi:MAG: YgfZ/GcvT domain-containing protein [Microthrixaceae bacterium]